MKRSYDNAKKVFDKMGNEKHYKNRCDYCDAWCCRRMLFPIYSKDHERWVKLHKSPMIKVITKWGRKLIELKIPCSKLKGNKCTIYRARPMMCGELDCETFEQGIMRIK